MIITAGQRIKEIRLGEKVIGKVMQGDRVVYQRFRLNITPALSFAAAGGNLVLSIDCVAWQTWTLTGVPAGWRASTTSGKGSAGPVLTAPNNTSTQAVSGVITVTSEGKTATCSLSQAAGAKVYEEIAIDGYSYSVIPAGGGSVLPSLAYSQRWTWNGVSGSGGTITSGATVSYYGSGVNSSTGAVSAASKETIVSGQTTVATPRVTIRLNGEAAAKTVSVYQAANVWIGYSDFTVRSVTYNEIPYIGGTVNPYVLATYSDYYSSGASESGKLGMPPGMSLRCSLNAPGFSVTVAGEVTAERNTSGSSRSATVYMDFVEDNILRDHKDVTVTQKGG